MKTLFFYSIFTITILLLNQDVFSQCTFSVAPGIQLNNASFGFKKNKFKPNIGLQILTASTSLTETGKKFDYNVNDIVNYEDKYKLSGLAIMPVIGLQYYFKESEKLKAYAAIDFTKVFVSAKIEDSSDPEANSDLQAMIKKINILGGQFGVGAEYFLDPCFSLGGEFGIRLFHVNYVEEQDHNVYNPNIGQSVTTKTNYNYNFSLNPTYAKLSFNFYFIK
jgi:hypothetical protein